MNNHNFADPDNFDRQLKDILNGTRATTQNGNEIWALDSSLGDNHVIAIREIKAPIEYFMASGTQITDLCLDALTAFPLVDLSIANTCVTGSGLLSRVWPESLTNLSVSGISLRSQNVEPLARLPRLSVLDISGCQLTPSLVGEICECSQVSFILAERNRIFGKRASELSSKWPEKQFCFSDGIWKNGRRVTMQSP